MRRLVDRKRLDPLASLRAGEPVRGDAEVVVALTAPPSVPRGIAIVVGASPTIDAWLDPTWWVWRVDTFGSIDPEPGWVTVRRAALDVAACAAAAGEVVRSGLGGEVLLAGEGLAGVGAAIALGAGWRGGEERSFAAEMLDDLTRGDPFHEALTLATRSVATAWVVAEVDAAWRWWSRVDALGIRTPATLLADGAAGATTRLFDALAFSERCAYARSGGGWRLDAAAPARDASEPQPLEPWRYEGWLALARSFVRSGIATFDRRGGVRLGDSGG